MEVEIKLQLADAAAHAKVLKVLAPNRKAAYLQRNYFFDSADARVSKFKRTLRVRFFDDDKAVLTIKVTLPAHESSGMHWFAVQPPLTPGYC